MPNSEKPNYREQKVLIRWRAGRAQGSANGPSSTGRGFQSSLLSGLLGFHFRFPFGLYLCSTLIQGLP